MSLFLEPPAGLVRPLADQPLIESTAMTTRIVAPGSVTDEEYGLFHTYLPADSEGAVPHFHRGFTESFYLLEGRLRVRLGDAWDVVSSGDLVRVPQHGIHAFRPYGDSDVRFLLLFTPAGNPREDYFAELAELHRRDVPPTAAEVDAVAARHDQVNVRD